MNSVPTLLCFCDEGLADVAVVNGRMKPVQYPLLLPLLESNLDLLGAAVIKRKLFMAREMALDSCWQDFLANCDKLSNNNIVRKKWKNILWKSMEQL